MRRLLASFALVSLLGATPALGGVTLLASAARTANGTATITAFDPSLADSVTFFLDITAAATQVADKLDVYVQHSWDGGTTWDDFAHATQADGNGGAVSYLMFWCRACTAPEDEERVEADAALAEASVLQGPTGSTWRLKWVITETGADDESFTFSVTADSHYGVR